MDDEQAIRELIERWVSAVQQGDLDAVTACHADDIVMFDVPPPERGVRGIDAYRATWPPFFDWLRSGSRFELDELSVAADSHVAFAHALLYCGTEDDFAAKPQQRLRLTIGLRKDSDAWVVTHEHHSFPTD